MALCTALNCSNGYTADGLDPSNSKNNLAVNYNSLDGKVISIWDNSKFENEKVKIYTNPNSIPNIKQVHRYFGDPDSEELAVNNNNGFFEIKDSFLETINYNNTVYGVAEYNGAYYVVLISDNSEVDGTVWNKGVFIIKNDNENEDYNEHKDHLDLLQYIPLYVNYKTNNNNLEDALLGNGQHVFLFLDQFQNYKMGPMTFYAVPPQNFKSIKAHTRFPVEDSPEITVWCNNKNGEFDIDLDELSQIDKHLYDRSYKNETLVEQNKAKYGILKYNNQYYLVNYNYDTVNNNNLTENLKIFHLGEINDYGEIQYLDEEHYSAYYAQIHNSISDNSDNSNCEDDNSNYVNNNNDYEDYNSNSANNEFDDIDILDDNDILAEPNGSDVSTLYNSHISEAENEIDEEDQSENNDV